MVVIFIDKDSSQKHAGEDVDKGMGTITQQFRIYGLHLPVDG